MFFLTILLAIVALVILVIVLQDAFEVMLLPRRVQRRVRLTSIYFRFAWEGWLRASRLVHKDSVRESILCHFGAFSMLGLFILWASALILNFGIIEWTLQPARTASASPLSEQIYMSGVTFFTLGYGDVVPKSGVARVTAVLEAGTGLGFIAVVIGYLPVLYQLFSRREAHVIQLDGRAGSPPTATALLDGLAKYLLLALPGWTVSDNAADHWTEGHRGLMARRIIEQLASRGSLIKATEQQEQTRVWSRIRNSLRD